MLTVDKFRRFVDASGSAATSFDQNKIIDPGDAEEASRTIALRIRKSCPQKIGSLEEELKSIAEGLVVEHLIEQRTLSPYRGLIEIIRDCLRSTRSDQGSDLDEPTWPEIVELAKEWDRIKPNSGIVEASITPFTDAGPIALASAANWMKDRGYVLVLENGLPVFSMEERERMVVTLEGLIISIGPMEVIERVFRLLKKNFSREMERYLDPPENVQIRDTEVKLPFPSNYVLQLAIKNIAADSSVDSSPDDWEKILEFAKNFAAIHNVRHYSQFETMFRNAHSIRDFIVDLALSDRLFRFRQLRSPEVPRWIEGLFDWVDDWHQRLNGWTIAKMKKVSEIILELAPATGPCILSKRKVIVKCMCGGVDPAETANILSSLCHLGFPNQDLVLPYHLKTITFGSRPLIKLDEDRLFLADKAMCGPGFYEAVAASFRPFDSKIQETQNKIGKAAERLLHKRLGECGISALCGKYEIGKETFECDCVIETEDHVIFIEQKGKALTEAAQTGGDLSILVDLLGAFFDSISQCYRHEIFLRKHGEIHLLMPDGSEKKIELNGRSIEKIGASLLDFGRFNDRSVIMQLLEIYPYAVVGALGDSAPEKVAKFNKKSEAIRTQIEELIEITGSERKDDPILASWFLSLPQLMLLAEAAGSNEGFKKKLWRTRHLSFQSLDWYTEASIAKALGR